MCIRDRAVGSNAATNGGNGGNGLSSSISGMSQYYGGGGGGSSRNGTPGTGGLGGGGVGGEHAANTTFISGGSSGTANTGGGGGGSTAYDVGGLGGSGIVIIRYLTEAIGPCGDTTQCLATVIAQNNILIAHTKNYSAFQIATPNNTLVNYDWNMSFGEAAGAGAVLLLWASFTLYAISKYASGGRLGA